MSELTAAGSTAPPLDVVARFNEAFNRQDLDAAMAFMTDDCLFEDTTHPTAAAMSERMRSGGPGSSSSRGLQMRSSPVRRHLPSVTVSSSGGATSGPRRPRAQRDTSAGSTSSG